MKSKRIQKEGIGILLAFLLSLVGTSSSEALCLKNCLQSEGQIQPRNRISLHDSSKVSESFNRKKSHDVSNSKNAITGDLHIQVGHQRMEIDNSNSPNSAINASVTSVINLGDVISTGDSHTTNNNHGEKQ